MTDLPLRHINTTPLEITWRDVLDLVALAYYQGLMVEMTKGSDAEVHAPAFTMMQLSQMRAFLGSGATDSSDRFLLEKLADTAGVDRALIAADELAARRVR